MTRRRIGIDFRAEPVGVRKSSSFPPRLLIEIRLCRTIAGVAAKNERRGSEKPVVQMFL